LKIEDKIKELKISIPDAPAPVGSYVPYKKIGHLLFISGQISIDQSGKILKGKIGDKLSLEDGQKGAKMCAINLIAQAKKACSGDLNNIKNCIKLTGFVNSTNTFTDQPKVINAASELISEIFSDKGKHTRAAVSVNSLPLGAAVEIDGIFEV